MAAERLTLSVEPDTNFHRSIFFHKIALRLFFIKKELTNNFLTITLDDL